MGVAFVVGTFGCVDVELVSTGIYRHGVGDGGDQLRAHGVCAHAAVCVLRFQGHGRVVVGVGRPLKHVGGQLGLGNFKSPIVRAKRRSTFQLVVAVRRNVQHDLVGASIGRFINSLAGCIGVFNGDVVCDLGGLCDRCCFGIAVVDQVGRGSKSEVHSGNGLFCNVELPAAAGQSIICTIGAACFYLQHDLIRASVLYFRCREQLAGVCGVIRDFIVACDGSAANTGNVGGNGEVAVRYGVAVGIGFTISKFYIELIAVHGCECLVQYNVCAVCSDRDRFAVIAQLTCGDVRTVHTGKCDRCSQRDGGLIGNVHFGKFMIHAIHWNGKFKTTLNGNFAEV